MKQIQKNKRGSTRLGLMGLITTIALAITGLGFVGTTCVEAAGGTCPITPEYAIFPNSTVNVSQIANGGYSHTGKNVTDIVPSGRVTAPFSGTIEYTDRSWGYVILQSDNPVRYADGSVDYMCVGFMHDNNISDLYVGKHLTQGQGFYDKGDKKGAGGEPIKGAHVHIIVMRGKFTKTMTSHYSTRGNVYIYDAFWLMPSTKVSSSSKYGGKYWRKLPGSCPTSP